MWNNAHDSYLESRILSADPVELIRLLYHAATGAVRDARRHLAEGNIAERSRSISKAGEILVELNGALDHGRGGEISKQLEQVYDYMQRKLLEANFHQSDALLAEVLGLLSTLSEGWDGVANRLKSEVKIEKEWMPTPAAQEVSGSLRQNWSL
ncbi:MAG TPA: flagellar export chaperone FliS [Bryobacteraceae bacterium]|nr:flagellar export chaperone FliS [Bryobacteraceae bacterium]